MGPKEIVQSNIGFSGKWENDTSFKVDPLAYGYLVPIQRVLVEEEGLCIKSSPITNTEWWLHLMPVSSVPPDVKYDTDDVEDGFIDLSAGRVSLPKQAEYIEAHYPRLQVFMERAMNMLEKTNKILSMHIGLSVEGSVVRMQAKVSADPDTFSRYCEAMKKLFTKITNVHGKVDTSALPAPQEFRGEDVEDIIQESKYYALKEAVRLETIDILNYIMSKKSGKVEGNLYILPNDKMQYTFKSNRVEAYRSGNYMGRIGFEKGVKQMQQFFATTLGGGRW